MSHLNEGPHIGDCATCQGVGYSLGKGDLLPPHPRKAGVCSCSACWGAFHASSKDTAPPCAGRPLCPGADQVAVDVRVDDWSPEGPVWLASVGA